MSHFYVDDQDQPLPRAKIVLQNSEDVSKISIICQYNDSENIRTIVLVITFEQKETFINILFSKSFPPKKSRMSNHQLMQKF